MSSKRTISSLNETGFLAKVVKAVFYARMDFSSGIQRVHTEIGPKTAVHYIYGSETYLGIGDYGGIDGSVVESVSGAPQALRLSLTGVKGTWIDRAIVDDYYRRSVEVMLGLEDESGVLLADPEIIFSGFMDTVTIALDESTAQMTLTCESRGTNLQRASDWRFTDEDKQIEVPGDLLGEYIYRMFDLQLFWGDRSFNSPFSPTGGPRGGGRGSRSDNRHG